MRFFERPRRDDAAFFVSLQKPKNIIIMPVHKVQGGWRWGQTGKVYPTQQQAEAQGRAIYASGYREKPKTK